MKAIVLVTLAVAALAAGKVIYTPSEVQYADKDFLMKQKAILEVFQHVHQKEIHTSLWTDSKAFNYEEYLTKYEKPQLVKDFFAHYNAGRLIDFDVPFTPVYEEHMTEAKMLFNVFYYAKDWETFYKTVEWAR
jgi:Hemocyanin, all-alpha domain